MVHIQEKLKCLKSGSSGSEDLDSDISVPLLFSRSQSQSQSQECVVVDDDVPRPCSNLPRELLLIIFRKLEDPLYTTGSAKAKEMHLQTKTLAPSSIPIPIQPTKWFFSSSFEWLLTIRVESPHQLSLLNPFTGHQISLPPAKDFFKDIHHYEPMEPDAYYSLYSPQKTRVITSASPLNPNCLILADHSFAHTFGNRLSFCRPGDKSWTDLDINKDCCDTIYYHGEFYAVDYYAYIYRLHCRDIPAAEKLPLQPNDLLIHYHTNYLVELDGHLLLVVRYLYNGFPEPSQFDVYKLDWLAKAWVRVESIHQNPILLGRYSSISLPASPTFQLECECKCKAEEKSKSWLSKIWTPIFTERRCMLCCRTLSFLYASWILCGMLAGFLAT
ncbi:hypothetical protein LWI28_010566 [Acer negundo]|uniref:KIB1-4 beta-propeller domain-containing protein n=1 Tax=Acer negundo TaxID=4023 RepID=A0AAD5NHJ9_ACENE|nr:hypothetical protein LWI28_010566 [Acer negundo]